MKKIAIIIFITLAVGIAFSQTGTGVIRRFLELTDTPSTYSGQASKLISVNSGETALEFTSAASGDLLADGTVPLTANWDVGNYDITLKSLTGDGTIEGATLTDGTATLTGGALTGLTTALTVAQGGTGATSLNDGFVLLGSNTAAITPLDVTTDGGIIIGDGTTDPVVLDVGSSTSITVLGTVATGVWQGTAIADAYVPDNITIDLATLATTLTITDNENTAENNALIFTSGGDLDGGNLGLECDGNAYYTPSTGTIEATAFTEGGNAVYSSGETPGGSLGGTWASPTIDDLFIKLGGDVASAGNYDFGGADLELPQASPGVPDADGEIEIDFTDGKMIIQHGSAHAELGAATDIAMGSLIDSWSGTIFEPDGVNDVITVKAINSIEFPHGVVITAIYLGVSSDTGYVLTVQNFDDFDTINGANGTIDTVTYSADTTGEIIDSSPTYATIAAGQIIMISIPSTDVDWIHFEIYYYEPAA